MSKERRSEFHDGLRAGAFERLLGDVGVQVSQRSGDWEMQWEGRIDGIRGEVDPKTRDLVVSSFITTVCILGPLVFIEGQIGPISDSDPTSPAAGIWFETPTFSTT